MSFVSTLLGIGVVLIWSTCYVTIKLSSHGDEPLTFAASRALLAGLVLLLLSTSRRCVMPPRDTWPWLAVSALTGTSLALWGMFGSVPIEGSAIASIRTQAGVGDQQFLRSMIPHHAGAILMCNEARVANPAIIDLCKNIV